jgi:hypothetical protein
LDSDVTICPECQGTTEPVFRCSFCGKSQNDIRKLIAGPKVYICDVCIEQCVDIIAAEWDMERDTRSRFLQALVADFARGLQTADARAHTETETLKSVLRAMCDLEPIRYANVEANISYPRAPRRTCDLVIRLPDEAWFVEVKLVRMMSDSKWNDDVLKQILSPYPRHRSALTDCEELVRSGFQGEKAVLLYGYECTDGSLAALMDCFESVAKTRRFNLGARQSASFENSSDVTLRDGHVHAWEVLPA